MFNRTISKNNIPAFIDFLIKEKFEVIAPVRDEVGTIFQVVRSGEEITLDYINTTYPPKNFFLPDNEILFEYRKKGKSFKLEENGKRKKRVIKRVIFGIRPCDVHGLMALDKIFIDDLKDPYYLEKRRKTAIIAINCNKAGEHCFCESMGTDKLEDNYDLLLTDLGDKYFVEIGSDLGKSLVKNSLFKFALRKPKRKKLRYKKRFNAKNIEKKLLDVFNDRGWEEVGKKCLSCGACTLICPTCYCFNVVDEPDFDGNGVRRRVPSYCMLLEFSRVANDVIFRKNRTERCKQFVYHKLSYFKERYGKQLCVGCGRCIEICPVNIDFFDTAEKILKRKAKKKVFRRRR